MKLLKLKKINKTDLYVIVEVTYKYFFGKTRSRKVNLNIENASLSTWMDTGKFINYSLRENIKAFLLMDIEEFVI